LAGRCACGFVVLVLTALAVTASANAAGPPTCQSDCVTTFTPPPVGSPSGIAHGPRGSIWYGQGGYLGQIDRRGNVTTHFIRSGAAIGWVTTGPKGAVWFAERGTGMIGVFRSDGSLREYALPSPDAVPQGIVFAPHGNVYVTEQGSNAIARVNAVTGEAVDIPVPTPDATVQSGVLGPDGAIWFIERSADKVGRMTLDGRFTEYQLTPGSFPNRIVVGPDGALWFSELFSSMLGRITTSGTLTEYAVPGGPVGITVGKDRQLYMALFLASGVVRVNTNGQVTAAWTLPGAAAPLQITIGFGLDIWTADAGHVYKLTPYATRAR
jgi:virginiamycin B lyase